MSIIEVKNRIKAIKNIGQITKAMEVVAATKMRKSQQAALNSRPYAFKSLQLLSLLANVFNVTTSDVVTLKIRGGLIKTRPVRRTLLVVITSDRGLAGSFNSQVLRLTDKYCSINLQMPADTANRELQIVAVGKKAIAYAKKKRINLIGEFSGFGDFIESRETEPLADLLIKGYLNKEWDKVVTISTHFRTTLKQEVLTRQVFPVDLEKIKQTLDEIIPEHGRFSEFREPLTPNRPPHAIDYIFEPNPKELIESLVEYLVRMQVYHIVLEANASEHSARMVAMKTASDNAKDLSEKLNLKYNKARQADITRELIEINAGREVIGT